MARTNARRRGNAALRIETTHSSGVRVGEMVFVGGQVDVGEGGRVLHPGDLPAQAEAAVDAVETILEELGANVEDVVKIVVFYVSGGEVDESALLASLAPPLPRRARTGLHGGAAARARLPGHDGGDRVHRHARDRRQPAAAPSRQSRIPLVLALQPRHPLRRDALRGRPVAARPGGEPARSGRGRWSRRGSTSPTSPK